MEYYSTVTPTEALKTILAYLDLPQKGWKRSISGFRNEVWVHDRWALKIYKQKTGFKQETWFYQNCRLEGIPQCEAIGENWILLERICGNGLFSYWPEWDRQKRMKAFTQGCQMIHELHQMNSEAFNVAFPESVPANWKEFILKRIEGSLTSLDQSDKREGDLFCGIEKFIRDNANALSDQEMVFTYSDFHLDNLLWDEKKSKVYLIDFENLCTAPPDYFLDTPLRMIAYPWLYANEVDDPRQKAEDYDDLMGILQRELPECFSHPQWKKRTALYSLAYDLRQLVKSPHHPDLLRRLEDDLLK